MKIIVESMTKLCVAMVSVVVSAAVVSATDITSSGSSSGLWRGTKSISTPLLTPS